MGAPVTISSLELDWEPAGRGERPRYAVFIVSYFLGFSRLLYKNNNIMDRYLVVFENKKPEYVDCYSLQELGRHIESAFGKAAIIKYIQRIELKPKRITHTKKA